MNKPNLKVAKIVAVMLMVALVASLITYQLTTAGFQGSQESLPFYVGAPQTYSYVIDTNGTHYFAFNGTTGFLEQTSTNASAAVNNALSNLTSGRRWYETIVLRGNFTFTSGIRLENYTRLCLNDATINLNLANLVDFIANKNAYNHHIDVIGGHIIGSPLISGSNNSAIEFNGVEYCVIDGVDVTNCSGIGLTATNFSKIINCKLVTMNAGRGNWICAHDLSCDNLIANNVVQGGNIELGDLNDEIYCYRNRVYDNFVSCESPYCADTRGCIRIYTRVDYTHIDGNLIIPDQAGILGITNTGTIISNNQIFGKRESADDCISLAAQHDLQIINNWINGSNGFAINSDNNYAYDGDNYLIDGNYINCSYDGGIRFEGYSEWNGSLIISNNMIIDCDTDGIDVLGWRGAQIFGNSIINNNDTSWSTTGISVQNNFDDTPDAVPHYCQISQNFIYNMGAIGIDFTGDFGRVESNTVVECLTGISVSGNNATVSDNVLLGEYRAIRVWANSTLIEGNHFNDTGSKDIELNSGTKLADIRYNFISAKTSPISNSGTNTLIRWNVNYRTESSGSQANTTATTFVFNHNLKATPVIVWTSFNATAVDGWTWTATSSQITITVTGTLDASTTCYWYAQTWNYP